MIKLYQFPPAWGLPNVSPFCMKVENYLRMAEIPYETVSNIKYLQRSPKHKLPYIEDNSVTIGDSTLIIHYLKQKYGDPLDTHLSELEKAVALSFQVLMEEQLYWVGFTTRWKIDQNWAQTKKAFFGFLPPILNQIIPYLIRKKTFKQIYAQGMGRHKLEEVYEFGKRDIQALSEFLGDKPYFMGEKPTTLDATAYAFLANFLYVPIESPVHSLAHQLQNLNDYCARMKERFYRE